MSLEALADAIQVDASDIVRSLFMKGIMLSLNQVRVCRRGGMCFLLVACMFLPAACMRRVPLRREITQVFFGAKQAHQSRPRAAATHTDTHQRVVQRPTCLRAPQVLDKNTVKLVAGEYDLLVVDKAEAGVTAGAVKQRDFLELEDLDEAVSVAVCVFCVHPAAVCLPSCLPLAFGAFFGHLLVCAAASHVRLLQPPRSCQRAPPKLVSSSFSHLLFKVIFHIRSFPRRSRARQW